MRGSTARCGVRVAKKNAARGARRF